jgi:outer membrane protein assembly factor BamB
MHARIATFAALAVVALTLGLGAGSHAALAALVDASGGDAISLNVTRTAATSSTPITINGSWPVYHRDNAHTGFDPSTPLMNYVTAGWVSPTLDAQVYASPLVYGGIVYTASLNNTVYALNQTDGSIVWSTNLGAPETGGWGCGNVAPQGILGTPVVDPSTGRIFVTALLAADVYHVVGLNLSTGTVEVDHPLTTTALTGDLPGFDWTIQQQRGALAVANGYVYVPFGGRAGDCGNYSGWVVAVPTSGTGATHHYRTPGVGSGIWTAGGVVVDDSTGKVFAVTGNADVSSGCGGTPTAPNAENDAVVRLSATLAEEDFFMPADWQNHWCTNDQDLGSASPVLISSSLLFQAGKWGTGFLLDPNNLGHIDGQRFPTPKPQTYSEADVCLGDHFDATFGSFAYATPFIYLECDGHGLVALRVDTSVPSFVPCTTCAAPDWHVGGTTTFGPPIVSGGAVWVATDGGGLYAFNQSTGVQMFHSASFGINRFVTPAEAGGQVFVPSHTVIRSFVMHVGVSQSSPAPSPAARTTPITQVTPAPTPSRDPASQSSPPPPPLLR